MMENLFTDHQNISLDKNASTLIIPIDETPEQYLDTFLYTVPIDYIWDVDIAIPQWISPTSF